MVAKQATLIVIIIANNNECGCKQHFIIIIIMMIVSHYSRSGYRAGHVVVRVGLYIIIPRINKKSWANFLFDKYVLR